MLLSPARRPSVAAANRQVSVDEVVDDLLVENSVYISLLRVQDSAQVDYGVSVFPSSLLAVSRVAQLPYQANRLRAQRSVFPPRVKQSVPVCFVHFYLLGLGWR